MLIRSDSADCPQLYILCSINGNDIIPLNITSNDITNVHHKCCDNEALDWIMVIIADIDNILQPVLTTHCSIIV